MSLELNIAILSERVEHDDGRNVYAVRPALDLAPAVDGRRPSLLVENAREDRALENLERTLMKGFHQLIAKMRHDELTRWSYCPPELAGRKIKLHLNLRKQTISGDFFLLTFRSMDRRTVLCPKVPGLSFDLERGESLEDRATEVLTGYFRKKEKADGKLDAKQFLSPGHTRLIHLPLTVRGKQIYQPQRSSLRFASISDTAEMDGAAELENVGRCLNRLGTARLQQAILREDPVRELTRHFPPLKESEPSPQPVVLVGESQVGKTAVIHEFLRRHLNDKSANKKREIWLLSPQRMISGMSYVGQWEERAHAIFKEAAKRRHLLYFDDLVGLFSAGKTSSSNLTVGHILKAYLEEEKLSVLAEAQPETIRRLREIDRGFADFFQPLPIREMSQADTMRVLVRTVQQLESEDRKIQFDPLLLPKIYDLQHRFASSRAFPGKAVEMLRQVARRSDAADQRINVIDDKSALAYFANKTGIQHQFLVPNSEVDREAVEEFFSSRIKGQKRAINAMSDLVISTSAQLNEPGKPVGSFLFLGPTGVGKTECTKALGEYFFGSDERILRFDMNEFVGPDAVIRLIGSQHRPSGLLTGAVRRSPFSIVLLDEIEKAHPEVFDLLLQMLGDGRLTDAAGQTVDFRNCIVVMTSNLGARDARQQLGFGGAGQEDESVYRTAAEKFFRPELFNRLDHIVAFHELAKNDIEDLVEQMTSKALSRAGMEERQMSLHIDPEVYGKLAEHGFQPEYGARALRRSIEENLIEPLALKLASLPANQPGSVTCALDTRGELIFRTSNLLAAKRNGSVPMEIPLSEGDEIYEAVNDFLFRAEEKLEMSRDHDSEDGSIDPSDPKYLRYFAFREELMTLRRMRDHYSSAVENERKSALDNNGRRRPSRLPENYQFLLNYDPNNLLDDAYESASPSDYVDKMAEGATILDGVSHLATQLVYRANSIHHGLESNDATADRILIHVSGTETPRLRLQLMRELSSWLSNSPWFQMHFHCLDDESQPYVYDPDSQDATGTSSENFWNTAAIFASGPGLLRLLAPIRGTHLFVLGRGKIEQVEVSFLELEEGQTPEEAYGITLGSGSEDPNDSQRNAVSIQSFSGRRIHFSSGLVTRGHLRIWDFINPHIPSAPEMEDFSQYGINQPETS